jgi:nicotinamidase-related amidase
VDLRMAERVWDPFLTEQDKAHLAASPPKGRYGFGRRPAILSVDNYRKAVGDRPEPLLEAVKTWPSSTGQAGWDALSRIEELFKVARDVEIPVIHVTALGEEESAVPGWGARLGGRHAPKNRTPEEQDRYRRRLDIVEQAAPVPGEVVLRKTAPSAFFGTPLAAHLIGAGIDTLIVCGESVSGCVRATVVDGCSLRLHMIVVEDCVYDRHEAARAINLFDMDQKYADVLPLAEVTDWMRDFARSGTP